MMMKTLLVSTLSACLMLVSTAQPEMARASLTAPATSETFTLDVSQGMDFKEFMKTYSELTGQRAFYDARVFHSRTITGSGEMTFRVERATAVMQTVLFLNGMAVVPGGNVEDEIVRIVDIRTSSSLKSSSQRIALKQLAAFDRPAQVISVVMPLRHLRSKTAMKTVNSFIQEHRTSVAASVEDANAVVLTGFPDFVRLCHKILADLDQESEHAPGNPSKNEKDESAPGGGR